MSYLTGNNGNEENDKLIQNINKILTLKRQHFKINNTLFSSEILFKHRLFWSG